MTARTTRHPPATRPPAAVVLAIFIAACDPVVGVAGAFFPGWIAAILIGIGLTVASRYVFTIARLEPYIGPPLLIYPSLALLLITASWLILYRS